MSYDICLTDPVTREPLKVDVPHFMQGGTYAINGTTAMWLNITYNYSPIFRKPEVLGQEGLRSIYGMSGAKSIPMLEKAIAALGDDVNSDYWYPSEGNAKKALCQLLALAQMRPDGIWDGD